MAERPEFGKNAPRVSRRSRTTPTASMFESGEELPLFSGTPMQAQERPYVPQDHSMKQALLPGMPAVDYDQILKKDKELRRKKKHPPLPDTAVLFADFSDTNQADPTTINLTASGREAISGMQDL